MSHLVKVPLKPGLGRHIRAGHPWVFKKAIEQAPRVPAGSVVDLTDEGRFAGRGYFDPFSAIAVRVLTNCWTASAPPYTPDCARRPVAGFTHKYLTQLLAAGVQVRAGPQSSGLFVHTKTIVRDAGGDKGDALATVSSENPGDYVSMSSERELGIFVATPDLVATIAATFNADWASATPVTA